MSQNDDSNVVVLKSFDEVEITDLRAGIKIYSGIERQVGVLREGISPWVYNVAYHFYAKAKCIPLVAAADFSDAMEEQVAWIISKDAGGLQLNKSQAMLTGKSPLASAFKKVHNTLLLGGDLNEILSTSACGIWNAERNKELQALKDEEEREKQITDHCKVELLRKDPTLDFENDDGAQVMLADAVTEYKASQANKAVNHLDSVDGEASVEEDEFYRKGREMADTLRLLYKATVPILGGNKEQALKQVMDAADGSIKHWSDRVESHREKLRSILEDDTSEVA